MTLPPRRKRALRWMLAFLLAPCLVLLTAGQCGGSQPPPFIESFAAEPATVAPGGESTLSWSVSGATRLRLEPGGADVTGKPSHRVSPAATTTYTLTAENAHGSSERQTTVTVSTPGALEVAITSLEALTHTNGSVTFTVAVTGGVPESLELRRDGQLFQVLTGDSFTWDSRGAPEGRYRFTARARLAGAVFDSPPKDVVVDRTPPAVTLTVTPSAAPLVLPGSVALAATAEDENGVARLELHDGATKLGEAAASPYALELPLAAGARGVRRYRARAVDLAGNAGETPEQAVVAYVRETVTLASEADLDGCVEYGYSLATHRRIFGEAACTFTTSYTILHFFSFDRAALPEGTLVEAATLRFALGDATAYEGAKLASVSYGNPDDAPPTAFEAYPYASAEPEVDVSLMTAPGGYPLADRQRLEVSALVQADLDAGRRRSQFRLRSLNNGPYGLGGSLYFAEVGDERAPTLELRVLTP